MPFVTTLRGEAFVAVLGVLFLCSRWALLAS